VGSWNFVLTFLIDSDKKNATTFALVHRPQNDPKIHDEHASDMVFKEVAAPNQKVSLTKLCVLVAASSLLFGIS
jgi:hypothetical protein